MKIHHELAHKDEPKKCTHPPGALFYYPAYNEAGWKCTECEFQPGEPAGFSPEMDREHIWTKVYCLLNDFANTDLISLSNGSESDYLTGLIAHKCKTENVFDQYSILLFILQELTPGHAEYWKGISEGVLAGKDPRNRCKCGKLATGSRHSNGKSEYTCSDHHNYGDFFADE